MTITILQLAKELNKKLNLELPIPLDNEKTMLGEVEELAPDLDPLDFVGKKSLSVDAAKLLLDFELSDETRKAAKALIKATPGVQVKATPILKKTKKIETKEEVIKTKPLKVTDAVIEKSAKKIVESPITKPWKKGVQVASIVKMLDADDSEEAIIKKVKAVFDENEITDKLGEERVLTLAKQYIIVARRKLHPPVNLRFAIAEKHAAGESDEDITAYAEKIYQNRGKTDQHVMNKTVSIYLKEAKLFTEAIKSGLKISKKNKS